MKYRIILNATTLPKGGGIQACVSFINMSVELSEDIEWYYVVSKQVADELLNLGIPIGESNMVVFNESPAQNRLMRKKLLKLTIDIDPDAIFTFFGPAYVRFVHPHLCGVADGWVTHSTSLAYRALNDNLSRIITFMRCVYKGFWYRYADSWVVEAECAREGLNRRLLLDKSSIHVVKNTCARHYLEKIPSAYQLPEKRKLNILTLSSYYPHKNLEIIPRVSRCLKELLGHGDFQFIITIPQGTGEEAKLIKDARDMGVENNIRNIGPVSIKDGPGLYASIDIVFMPSLLETFSANYPEAMASEKPIVTTDLDFAHDICGRAALYYSPLDANAAAQCIKKIINDGDLVDELLRLGKSVLKTLPTAEDKYRLYESIIVDMIDGSKYTIYNTNKMQ